MTGEATSSGKLLMNSSGEIQVGDWVEHKDRDLDPRRVACVGDDWLLLDFQLRMPRERIVALKKSNYRITQKGLRDG